MIGGRGYKSWVVGVGVSNIECCMKCGILKSSEDMILALTGQFKQLSHEPEKCR